jgi:hypothetical protein
MNVLDRLTGNAFEARPHGTRSQPPASIRDFKAFSRVVPLNGVPTVFFFGEEGDGNRHGTRVTFSLGGIWYHVTNNEGQPENLYEALHDQRRSFQFVTQGRDNAL